MVEKLFSDPFLKNQTVSLDQSLVFIFSWVLSIYIETNLHTTCFYLIKARSQVSDNFGNWKTFKLMKNAFYFTLKVHFVKFCLNILAMKKTAWLER